MLLIAHRGASAVAPENTLASFERALDAKADGIEIDIIEVDGEIYVFHDRYLERLAAQPGRIQDLTQAQISTLKVFGQHPIPTLQETLSFLQGRCLLNIEMKSEIDTHRLAALLDWACAEQGFANNQLLVSSFDHHWLQSLKNLRPQTLLGALTASCHLDYAAFATTLEAWSAHIDINVVNSRFVEDAHQRGLKVFVYTVDEAHDIAWLKKMGVDGIFTNHPQLSRNILEGLPVSQNSLLRQF
ncbi:glycerophosphodiester phosphodiesterase [Aliidiomarina celeris]|uniref:glycerophosphodiester phosphodiesterase n=1 Tax=Aliidiomarina celeris TaxID=2249428 RepID=UPI000DE92CD3|nr:glycerophosphodiester phosphodiesterase family protein [Aliidiomarina celeris]